MVVTANRRCRSVAIIGAGFGFGREVALAFAADDAIVFGTSTSADEVQDLKLASGGRVSLAVCDVSKADAVGAWAGGVADALDGAGLDILITSATSLRSAPIESLSLEAIRREFDTNVLGTLSVINAFLPALRRARGRIVQINTWAAHVPMAVHGSSAASEIAIETLLSMYRSQLKAWGVELVIAITGTEKAALSQELSDSRSKPQDDLQSLPAFASREAASRVLAIAEQRPAPVRVAIDRDADLMLSAARDVTAEDIDTFCARFLVPD